MSSGTKKKKKISCLSNLLTFHNDVFPVYDVNKLLDVVQLYVCKAFGKISVYKLVYKVKHVGIDGSVYQLIANELNNKQQILTIDGVASGLSFQFRNVNYLYYNISLNNLISNFVDNIFVPFRRIQQYPQDHFAFPHMFSPAQRCFFF